MHSGTGRRMAKVSMITEHVARVKRGRNWNM